jgi:hypothetical protein
MEHLMKKVKVFVSVLAVMASSQASALAHAPIVPIHLSGLKAARTGYVNMPVSGSSKAFALNIKTLAGVVYKNTYQNTLQNTILTTPLNGISGTLNGVSIYSFSNGVAGPFYVYPSGLAFGSSPLNIPSGPANSISNSFSGFPTSTTFPTVSIRIFPSTIGGHGFSGAERALQGYYNGAASAAYNSGRVAGYNGGILALEHPTGGLLFGTTYYNRGGSSFQSYPGGFAFGNNYYASAAGAAASNGTLSLTQPLASYLQFGSIIRPVSNGFVIGELYYASGASNPPYGTNPGPFLAINRFAGAFGSNALNTFSYSNFVNIPLNSLTFFK